MNVRTDPDEFELTALSRFAGSLAGKLVLEVGCGDGRLTEWLAETAAYVLAIDPDERKISRARRSLPRALRPRVEYQATGIESLRGGMTFDLVLLSWSL